MLAEFKKTPWVSLYKPDYFDCTEMSALLQRELTIRGFESWIVIGKDPNVPSGHAWVVVFLRSPSIQLVPVEATALELPQPGSSYSFSNGVVQTYNDYSRQGWVLQDIYQAIAWWPMEFSWFDRTDILQKLGLPTIVTTPPIPTSILTLAPSSLPSGQVGVAYSATLTISGGIPPYSWTNSGSVPPWLLMLSFTSSSNIGLSGTPTTAGSYSFTVTVSDSSTPPLTASMGYTITISAKSSTPTPTPTPPTPVTPPPLPALEIIHYTMPPGSIAGSVVSYSKVCQTGEMVTGFAELTGTYYSSDWSYTWSFQVLGPGGESLEDWQGNWVSNNHHVFNFKTSYAGTYKIRVCHASCYPKNLTIEIRPPGWGYSAP